MIWALGQIVVLLLLILIDIILLNLARKSDFESQKAMFKGFGLFVVACSIIQALYVMQIFYSRAFEGRDLIPRFISIGGTGYEYVMFMGILLGFSFLMKPIENYLMQRPKAPITKLDIIGLVLLLIPYLGAIIYSVSPWDEYWTWAAYPGVGIGGLGVVISIIGSFWFYIRLGLKSTGMIRTKGYLIGFGIFLMYIGILVGQFMEGWLVVLNPLTIVIGAWMVIRGQKIQI
jgi:hypothetical protein